MNLLRGQRIGLSNLIPHSLPFTARTVVNAPLLCIDFSCFGLDTNNKLSDDRYMSFFNQPITPCAAVRFECSANNAAVFLIDLQKLPEYIDRLVITAAIDGNGTMSQLISGAVTLSHSNIEAVIFPFAGDDFTAEKTLILMEIYRKDGSWRVYATGQGFNGGLDALVRYFGGTITESPIITQESVEQLPSSSPSQSFLQRIFKPLFKSKKPSNASPAGFDSTDIVIKQAQKTLCTIGASLNIANQSKKLSTRNIALKKAQDELATLKEMATQHPFLNLQHLPALETDIIAVKAELLALSFTQPSKQEQSNTYPALNRETLQEQNEKNEKIVVNTDNAGVNNGFYPPFPSPNGIQRSANPDHVQDVSNKNSYWKPLSNKNNHWKPQGTAIKMADVVIEGGFLYFGSDLCSIGSRSQIEPALIDPKLAVSALASANYQQRTLSYWSSYSGATPDARAAYIKWLINGRNDPLADVGYVFLYFYGLERRALTDIKTDATAKAELPGIIQEVERLLDIYRGNSSFHNYATGFLSLLKLDHLEANTAKQYLVSPPNFGSGRWPLPLTLKLALGQLALDNEPVPADWAYAWLITDPRSQLKTPANRCAVEFKQVFISKYRESFGNGIKLPVNKTKINISYYTASASFLPNRTIEKKSDIPDVTVLNSCFKKLQSLADQCTETLNPYSRFLGRNPELKGTLDALLELPYSLWSQQQKQHLQTIKHRIETSQAPITIEFTELKSCLPEWKNMTKNRVALFINRLTEAGLGMEPDLRFDGPMPDANTKVVLFIDNSKWLMPTPRYTTALLTLDLAVIVSLADGEIGQTERNLLTQQVEDWLHLEAAEKNRLHAHLHWLLAEHPDVKTIKKRVKTLPESARQVLADFLVLVAHADNKVSPNEVKILEKIYKLLNLDVQSLYGKLHGTSSDEPVTVRLSQPNSSGFSIPDASPPSATGFQLDMNRVAALKNESQKATEMLVALFEQDVTSETLMPSQMPADEPMADDNGNLLGLDRAHSDLIKLLCSRTQWSRGELEEIAADAGMMLDGALEHINEATYDSFDAPLTEGDDPIDINQDILKELLCDNDPS